jgi:carboxypeptidase Taq
MSNTATINTLQTHLSELKTLQSTLSLIQWDMQVMMPPAGAQGRGEEISLLTKLIHERLTDPKLGDLLDELSNTSDLNEQLAHGVHNMILARNRATKLPTALVRQIADAESEGFNAWQIAKKEDDFAAFAPHLERHVNLAREKSARIDANANAYDVLLEEFEPGARVEQITPMFQRLGAELKVLIDKCQGGTAPQGLTGSFDTAGQVALSNAILPALGYDLNAGRLDTSSHPFSVGIHPGDCRITTRFEETDLLAGLGATIHETGHAMYEQGLPLAGKKSGWGDAASYGMHESQSRFWENFIGGSHAFAQWLAPLANQHLAGHDFTADKLFGAANAVNPDLIRVYADEVTYNLHIIIRYELELSLISGSLCVTDLPDAWRERYQHHLGITPPNNAQGVLQDVHWSGGAFGYFPTYTIGNLYAASIGAHLTANMPTLWDDVACGEFGAVLQWLRTNIHSKGHSADAAQIVCDAVGKRDHVADLMDHLWGRQGALYGVTKA